MTRINVRDAAARIACLQAFNAGNLRAENYYVLSGFNGDFGQLPIEYADRLRRSQRERTDTYMAGGSRTAVADAPFYVVYSYDTPIAWVTLAGEVVIPDVRYSATTSQHQAAARRALASIDPVALRAHSEG
jgi:hypothetical protein